MEFKKGQRAQWTPGGSAQGEVEIVYGPVSRDSDMGYLVKYLEGYKAGRHGLVGAGTLRPLPPQVGDLGKRAGHWPTYEIRFIDDEWVLLVAEDNVSQKGIVYTRAAFENAWEPLP